MANISDATGTITVIAESKNVVHKIASILSEYLYKGEYNTIFSVPDFDDCDFWENEKGVELQIDFNGTGRWCFSNNIQHFGTWINYDLKNHEEDREYLEHHEWELIYDYVDYEGGCQVFYTEIDSIKHDAGEPIEKVKFSEGETEYIDINPYNIMKYEYADSIDDALSYLACFDMDEMDEEDLEYASEYCEGAIQACMDDKHYSRSDAINFLCEGMETFPYILNNIK